jgi:predicted O-methyltransferase YrrM
MKQFVKFILPHGIVRILQTRQERGYRRGRAAISKSLPSLAPLDQSVMLDFIASRGVNRAQASHGTMPEASLAFLASLLRQNYDNSRALIGLHVGNFVGISLAYLAHVAKSINSTSLVIAVDPNLEHRGISNPQNHACALLDHFALSGNVLLCCGFSHEKNVSNDGRNYLDGNRLLESAEVEQKIAQEHAPHSVIDHLKQLQVAAFDFALIDGNHESAYVQDELVKIHPLMRKGGLIFMDDISEGWPMLKQVFENSSNKLFRASEADGRVGVLEVL